MEARKMVLMSLFAGQQWRRRHRELTMDTVVVGGKEGGGMNGESSIETYTPPYVRQIASGSLWYDSGNSSRGSVTT